MYAAANNDQMLQYPPRPLVMERRWNKSNAAEVAPNCPRCASPNTKFCYYNNYSFSQPRYFCKGCRRYWTRGGSLRDVPVGGGCRKTRRAKAVRSSQNQRPSTITSDPPLVAPPSRSGGSDIDLAEVFAKFLNQNQNQNQNSSVGNTDQLVGLESPNESNSNPLLLTQETGDQNQQEEEQLVQEFVDRDLDSLGLQTMVSDHELDQDLLWCDDATALPGFSWQPMVELQEFGSFSSDDDQPDISANVISDNWNLFDLSAYI